MRWDGTIATRQLDDLQDRLRYAARIDRRGEALLDYQTVDLGMDWMLPEKAGWTTRGRIAERGGRKRRGTHQRYRHYRADSVHTVALTLVGDGLPSLDDVAAALREPARPLFIGRKCCLPAGPLLLDVARGRRRSWRAGRDAACEAARTTGSCLPLVGRGRRTARPRRLDASSPVTDERDWRSRVHVGRRLMREGHVDPPEAIMPDPLHLVKVPLRAEKLIAVARAPRAARSARSTRAISPRGPARALAGQGAVAVRPPRKRPGTRSLGLQPLRCCRAHRPRRAFGDPSLLAAIGGLHASRASRCRASNEGRRLGFVLRACPVVRLAGAKSGHRAGAEVDAFLARCFAVGKETAVSREEVYRDWLTRTMSRPADHRRERHPCERIAAGCRVSGSSGGRMGEARRQAASSGQTYGSRASWWSRTATGCSPISLTASAVTGPSALGR